MISLLYLTSISIASLCVGMKMVLMSRSEKPNPVVDLAFKPMSAAPSRQYISGQSKEYPLERVASCHRLSLIRALARGGEGCCPVKRVEGIHQQHAL